MIISEQLNDILMILLKQFRNRVCIAKVPIILMLLCSNTSSLHAQHSPEYVFNHQSSKANNKQGLTKVDFRNGNGNLHQSLASKNTAINQSTENWVSVGPFGIKLSNEDVISGQVNAIAVDPRDANTLFVGASEGGVWKTTDGGATWRSLTDYQLARNDLSGRRKGTMAVGSIAINPVLPNIIYVGTGNPNLATGFQLPSLGVFRSTDGGNNWQPTGIAMLHEGCNNESISLATVNRMVITRDRPSVVYAATNKGLFRYAEDGADCWKKLSDGLPAASNAIDLTIDPFRGVLYVAFDGRGIFKSADPIGQTWTKLTNGLPSNGFGRIALTFGGRTLGFGKPDELVYAGFAMKNPEKYQLFKTTDGGASWIELPSPPNQGQLGFNNAIAVGSYNQNELYIGQITLWKAFDGGKKGSLNNFRNNAPIDNNSWFDLSCCLSDDPPNPFRQGMDLHADIHDIVFAPYQSFSPTPSQVEIVYIANDGGVTKGDINFEGKINWKPLTQGLAIGQVGTIGLNSRSPAVTASGLWHNGNAWTRTGAANSGAFGGGDGFQATIDAGIIQGPGFIHQIAYWNCNAGFGGEICRSKITSPTRSEDQGMIWADGKTVKFWSDPYRAGHLLRLQKDDGVIYRTKVASTASVNILRSAGAWQTINPPAGKRGSSRTLAFRSAILESQPIYYIGTDSGQIWRGSPEAGWTKVCECGSPVNAIAPDLTRNERIFVAFQDVKSPGRIKELIREPNSTWSVKNIDDFFLPELRVSLLTSIVADPMVPESQGTNIYVGTDQGVYRGHLRPQILDNTFKIPTAFDWEWTHSHGVPNILVTDMEVHQSLQFRDRAGIIRAGTYGRGVFELKRSPERIITTFPFTIEVVAMQQEIDGAPPSINATIQVVTQQKKFSQKTPFELTLTEGKVSLEAPSEIRSESGRLKFVGWVISGKRRGSYNKVTLEVDDAEKAVAFYEFTGKKAEKKEGPPAHIFPFQ